MFWLFYNLVFHLVYLLLLPHFFLRMRRRGGYRDGFAERWGKFSPEKTRKLAVEPHVWVHAVSVGEFHVAMSFMRKLREKDPALRFVLTVNTSTAQHMARDTLEDRDVLLYPPIDSPFVLRRVLRTLNPSALVLVENEVWPNLCRSLQKRSVPIMLLNGRLSDRSFRRMEKVRPLTRRVYGLLDVFCMQSQDDADRIVGLGAPLDRVHVLHSAKYEVAERDIEAEAVRRQLLEACGFLQGGPVLMGSSTWPGEEEALCHVFQECRSKHPGLKLLLVPRHAERMAEVEEVLKTAGLRYQRRTQLDQNPITDPEVFVLDTTGELRFFYACADLVFVGKSLLRVEGQSPVEAALAGCSVVTGPGMSNFRRIMQDLREADAVREVADAADLEALVLALLEDDARRMDLGGRAAALVVRNSGAVTRSVELFWEELQCHTHSTAGAHGTRPARLT